MVICHGAAMRPLTALDQGANATWFTATLDPQVARKRWISAMKPRGTLTLDAGAARALFKGNSLLPAGVHAVRGTFGRGDPVAITGPDGHHLGLGLSRYTAEEAQIIKGHHSGEIEQLLGYPGRAALIHRDDMAL